MTAKFSVQLTISQEIKDALVTIRDENRYYSINELIDDMLSKCFPDRYDKSPPNNFGAGRWRKRNG